MGSTEQRTMRSEGKERTLVNSEVKVGLTKKALF